MKVAKVEAVRAVGGEGRGFDVELSNGEVLYLTSWTAFLMRRSLDTPTVAGFVGCILRYDDDGIYIEVEASADGGAASTPASRPHAGRPAGES